MQTPNKTNKPTLINFFFPPVLPLPPPPPELRLLPLRHDRVRRQCRPPLAAPQARGGGDDAPRPALARRPVLPPAPAGGGVGRPRVRQGEGALRGRRGKGESGGLRTVRVVLVLVVVFVRVLFSSAV